MIHKFYCHDCKKDQEYDSGPYGGGVGYCAFADGAKVCYACVAARDKAQMERGEPIVLYVSGGPHSGGGWKVTNWPGTLIIRPERAHETKRLWRRWRVDVWFTFAGRRWHGANVGDNQILRCRPLGAKKKREDSV